MPSSSAFLHWQQVFSGEADAVSARREALPTTSATGVVRGMLGQRLGSGLDDVSRRLGMAEGRSRDLAGECGRRAAVCMHYRDAVAAAHAAYASAMAAWSIATAVAALDPVGASAPGPTPVLVLPPRPAPWADPA